MAGALKKHLGKMALQPDDVLLFHVPLGAPREDYVPFLDEVQASLEAEGRHHAIMAVQPGFHWSTAAPGFLASHGLLRVLPQSFLAGEDHNLNAMEDTAHQAVRLLFEALREGMNNGARTTGDPASE